MSYSLNEGEAKIRKKWLIWMIVTYMMMPILSIFIDDSFYFTDEWWEIVGGTLVWAFIDYFLAYEKTYTWFLTCQNVFILLSVSRSGSHFVQYIIANETVKLIAFSLCLLIMLLKFALNAKLRRVYKDAKKARRTAAENPPELTPTA